MSITHDIAAGILPAVERGILPPGSASELSMHLKIANPSPPGRMPGSTSGKLPDATLP